jgi:hypothetical protein
LPEPEQIEDWKKQYLEVWNAHIDEFGPTPEYKRGRRRMTADVFARFARAARKQKRRYRLLELRISFPGKPLGQPLAPEAAEPGAAPDRRPRAAVRAAGSSRTAGR